MGLLLPFRSMVGGLPPLAMASRKAMLRIWSAKTVKTGLTPGLFSWVCRLPPLVVGAPRVLALLLLPSVRVMLGTEAPRVDTLALVPGPPASTVRAKGFQYRAGSAGTQL